MKKEIRNYRNETTFNERRVTGYAVVFNSYSHDLGGFKEIIEPTALDGIIEISDVLCLMNHDEDRGVLARSKYGKGTLELTIDEHGLKYSFEAPRTALGDELLEGLNRGDITTSSFAFTVAEEQWDKDETGADIRIIKKIDRLYDVSPVYQEAYPDTDVAQRNHKQHLNNYFLKLRKSII